MFDILRPDERAGCRLRQLYHSYGYLPYRMSKFEPYDLYAGNKDFLVSENILTFTDTDGRLMALKPDVTLSIVRSAPDSAGATQKVYYQENVYRTSAGSMGYREIMQAGLECIGLMDLAAVGEVVALAAKSLALLGRDWLLDLGHVGFVSGLLEGVSEGVRGELLTELGRKNTSAIRMLCAQAGAAHDLAEKLCCLSQLYGTPKSVLPQLEELAEGPQATEALAELKSLCQLLEGESENLRLDFSIVGGMRYYNGVIFQGYLPGLASGVLSGGQYDNLLHRMGKQGGAIGFAVYLDQLERLDAGRELDVDVLLLYGPGDSPAAVSRRAKELAGEGKSVRTGRSVPQGLRYRELVRIGEGGCE